jgi:hypothetical protein
MRFVAAVIKWAMENPKMLRYGLLAVSIMVIAGWFFCRGVSHEAAQVKAAAVEKAVTVKGEYDEISNHRPDDLSLLDLLQHGQF